MDSIFKLIFPVTFLFLNLLNFALRFAMPSFAPTTRTCFAFFPRFLYGWLRFFRAKLFFLNFFPCGMVMIVVLYRYVYICMVDLPFSILYIYTNDFLQVEISNWYYVFTKWFLNNIKSRNIKYRKLIFKKSLPNKYILMKQRKQKSNYSPKWIINIQYDFIDVKSYLEVDFFTLSMFFIYDYNFLNYHSPTDLLVIRNSIIRMYNWKYIN